MGPKATVTKGEHACGGTDAGVGGRGRAATREWTSLAPLMLASGASARCSGRERGALESVRGQARARGTCRVHGRCRQTGTTDHILQSARDPPRPPAVASRRRAGRTADHEDQAAQAEWPSPTSPPLSRRRHPSGVDLPHRVDGTRARVCRVECRPVRRVSVRAGRRHRIDGAGRGPGRRRRYGRSRPTPGGQRPDHADTAADRARGGTPGTRGGRAGEVDRGGRPGGGGKRRGG